MSPREIAAKISKLYSDAEIKTLCRYKDKFVAFLVDPNDRDGHYDDNYVVFTEDGKQIAYSLFNDFEMLGGLEQVPFGEWHGGAMTQSGVRAADSNSLEHYNREGAADSLEHYNRKGSHWYEHKYGKWQKQAKYAGGMDDPKGYDAGPLLDSAERYKEGRVHADIFRKPGYYDKIDLKSINPKRSSGRPEYVTNCAYCTMAFDLNHRGYKVQAAPCVWFKMEDLDKYYPGAKKQIKNYTTDDPYTNRSELYKYFLSRNPGERGYLSLQTDFGGHAMAWNINRRGVPEIIDAQNAKVYDFMDLQMMTPDMWCGYRVTRLDNLDFNKDTIDDIIDTKEGKTTWQDLSDEVEDARKKVKHSDGGITMGRFLISDEEYIAKKKQLEHYGVKDMKWRQHKFGKWQKQAKYANGMDDPNAKQKDGFGFSLSKKTQNNIVKSWQKQEEKRPKSKPVTADQLYGPKVTNKFEPFNKVPRIYNDKQGLAKAEKLSEEAGKASQKALGEYERLRDELESLKNPSAEEIRKYLVAMSEADIKWQSESYKSIVYDTLVSQLKSRTPYAKYAELNDDMLDTTFDDYFTSNDYSDEISYSYYMAQTRPDKYKQDFENAIQDMTDALRKNTGHGMMWYDTKKRK